MSVCFIDCSRLFSMFTLGKPFRVLVTQNGCHRQSVIASKHSITVFAHEDVYWFRCTVDGTAMMNCCACRGKEAKPWSHAWRWAQCDTSPCSHEATGSSLAVCPSVSLSVVFPLLISRSLSVICLLSVVYYPLLHVLIIPLALLWRNN